MELSNRITIHSNDVNFIESLNKTDRFEMLDL